jgi:hypothetical protein
METRFELHDSTTVVLGWDGFFAVKAARRALCRRGSGDLDRCAGLIDTVC